MDALTRTLPPTRRALGDVDPAQPLDLTHPLLDGVRSFWLPLPRTTGGSRLYDLSAHGRHGDLTLMDPATDWLADPFVTTPFLDFEQDTKEYVRIDDEAADIDQFTIIARVYQRPANDSYTPINIVANKATSGGTVDGFAFQTNTFQTTDSKLKFNTGNGTNKAVAESPNQTIEVEAWQTVAVKVDRSGGTATLFQDGEDVTSSSGILTDFDTKPPIWIGALTDSKPRFSWNGYIQSVIFLDRLPSSAEMNAWHSQARRGFPDLLNRRSDVGLLGGGGGGTTKIVVNSDFSGRAGTVGSDVAVRQALESTLSGAPGTLSATTRALPSITTDLQGNQGTFASGIASIAAVEAAMTGRPGSLTSQAAVLQALTAGLSGQAGTLDIQLSTSQLTSVNVDASGAKGSLSSTLASRLALQSALQGASGTISAEVGIPLSLDADFAGARGDLVATLGDFRTVGATLDGRSGTLSVAAELIQQLQATLQGAAGTSTAVARVTQAVGASLDGNPGQLTSILGDIGALATIDARLRDELQIDAILDDALSIDADFTD